MKTVKLASLFMAAFVMLGAFGAHGLKEILDDYSRAVYEKAVFYHAVHGLGLFVVAWLQTCSDSSALKWSARLFTVGIFLFSGSLYLLAITGIKWLGAITPLGGLSFIAGWLLLAFSKRSQ